VKEVRALKESDPNTYSWVNLPEGMGDDYVVYVNDVNNPSAINGFRTGMNWFNSSGTPVEDPKVIRGAAGIAPWLTNPSQETPNETAFQDYKAQVNVMPRIAFSFPISDEASFFAHYDVLTKRPTTGFRFNPYEYQFIQSRNAIINNANLKPETTVDYELGFQQVLSRTSSLKISAFYREQRNNVQLINMFEAYPATYRTFGNRDFGTVKGVTVSYDLRQTGNVRLTAAYTLQFADGTGSNATTAAGLVNAVIVNTAEVVTSFLSVTVILNFLEVTTPAKFTVYLTECFVSESNFATDSFWLSEPSVATSKILIEEISPAASTSATNVYAVSDTFAV
jgi:outer membrane receptor protein involved in Fe transport